MATYDKYIGDASSMVKRPDGTTPALDWLGKGQYVAYGSTPTNPTATNVYTNLPTTMGATAPLRDTFQAPNIARPDLGGIVNLTRPPGYNPNMPNQQMATEQFERLARTSPASVSGAQRRAVQAADMAAKAETQGKPLTKFEQRIEEIKARGEEARKTVGVTGETRKAVEEMRIKSRQEQAKLASTDKKSLAEYNRGTEEMKQGMITARETGNREDEQKFKSELLQRKAELEAAQKDTDYARSVQDDFRNNVFKNKQEAVSSYLKAANDIRLQAFKEGGDETDAETKAQAFEAKAAEAMRIGEQGIATKQPTEAPDIALADANKDGIVDEQERLTIINELPMAEALLAKWKKGDPSLRNVDPAELAQDIERAMQVTAKGKIWKQQFQPKA